MPALRVGGLFGRLRPAEFGDHAWRLRHHTTAPCGCPGSGVLACGACGVEAALGTEQPLLAASGE